MRPGIPALQKRIEDLREQLRPLVAEIDVLEQERDRDLATYQTMLGASEASSEMLHKIQDNNLRKTAELRQQGLDMIAKGQETVERANRQYDAASFMDTGEAVIKLAKKELRDREDLWRARLSNIQPPEVRRKRAQLAKDIERLEKRLVRKEREPEYATGAVSVVPK